MNVHSSDVDNVSIITVTMWCQFGVFTGICKKCGSIQISWTQYGHLSPIHLYCQVHVEDWAQRMWWWTGLILIERYECPFMGPRRGWAINIINFIILLFIVIKLRLQSTPFGWNVICVLWTEIIHENWNKINVSAIQIFFLKKSATTKMKDLYL